MNDRDHHTDDHHTRIRGREHTELFAREAARLYHEGKAKTISDAIHKAAQQLGHSAGASDAPSHGRVRKHVQALSMQAMGSDAYADAIKERLRAAEQLMSALDEHYAGVPIFLMGRAARGHVDGDTTLHIRIYTDEPIDQLAQTLVDLGYNEPKFETANTRLGKLNRMRIRDADADADILLTRLLPAMLKSEQRDLFTNAAIATQTLKQLRDQLGA